MQHPKFWDNMSSIKSWFLAAMMKPHCWRLEFYLISCGFPNETMQGLNNYLGLYILQVYHLYNQKATQFGYFLVLAAALKTSGCSSS